MDQLLHSLWPVFNHFQNIQHRNISTFNEDGSSLNAAKIASCIYQEDYLKQVTTSSFKHSPYTSYHKVRCDFIQSTQDDQNAILVIRGTCNFYNWVLNMIPGKDIFGLVGMKILLALSVFILCLITTKSVAFIALALPIYFFTTLAMNFFFPKVYFHQGYISEAEEILSYYKIPDHLNLLVIGHSMGGGIGEEILRRRPNTKAFFFNKAPLITGVMNGEYRNHSIDHRLSFDILGLFTSLTFGVLEKSATLKSHLHHFVAVYFSLILALVVGVIWVGKGLGILMALRYYLSAMVMIINAVIFIEMMKTLLPQDHLLKNILVAIEKKRFISYTVRT